MHVIFHLLHFDASVPQRNFSLNDPILSVFLNFKKIFIEGVFYLISQYQQKPLLV